jgi:hypothetical protein
METDSMRGKRAHATMNAIDTAGGAHLPLRLARGELLPRRVSPQHGVPCEDCRHDATPDGWADG